MFTWEATQVWLCDFVEVPIWKMEVMDEYCEYFKIPNKSLYFKGGGKGSIQ